MPIARPTEPEPQPRQELSQQASTAAFGMPIDVAEDEAGGTAGESEPADEAICFEPVSSDSPVSATALFGSRGTHQEEDVADEPLAIPRPIQRAAPCAAEEVKESADGRCSPGTETGGEESEESIEVMFARLLKRVGQPREETSYEAPAAAKPRPAPASVVPSEVIEEDKPSLLTELPTRAGRPAEHNTDLSALRELAHLNTRSLLDVHLRRSFERTTAGQAVVTCLALLVGIILMYWAHQVPLAFYLAILCFAVAIVWGVQNAAAVRRMVQDRWLRKAGASDHSHSATPARLHAAAASAHATAENNAEIGPTSE